MRLHAKTNQILFPNHLKALELACICMLKPMKICYPNLLEPAQIQKKCNKWSQNHQTLRRSKTFNKHTSRPLGFALGKQHVLGPQLIDI